MKSIESILFKYISKIKLYTYLIVRIILKIYFLISPIITMTLIDSAVSRDIDKFINIVIISLVLFLVEAVLQVFSDYLKGALYTDNFIQVTNKLVKKAIYHDRNVSDLNFEMQLSQNYELVSKYFFEVPINVIFSFITIVCILSIVFSMSVSVGIVLGVGTPFAIFVSDFFSKKLESTTEKTALEKNKAKQFFNDCFILRDEDRFLENKQLTELNLKNLLNNYNKLKLKQERELSLINNIFVYGMLNLLILVVLIVSGYNVLQGTLTVGMLNAFQVYTSQLWYPIENLIEIRRDYVEKKLYIKELIKHLELEEQEINFNKINSIMLEKYQSKDNLGKPLHSYLDTTINADNINIIIGDNGIGKTSLIHAIIGFSDRYTGNIFINKKNKENIIYNDLVYVPANVYISEIGSLKNYSTSSSGQKKLAQLEFAFKSNKSTYILDEPTNFLDTHKKDLFWEQVIELQENNKLIIIITNDDYLKDKLNINKIHIKV